MKNRLKKIDEMSESLGVRREVTQKKIDQLTFKGFDKYIGKALVNMPAYFNRMGYYKILSFERYQPETDFMHVICIRVRFEDQGVDINNHCDCLYKFSTFLDNIKFITEIEFQNVMGEALKIIRETNEKLTLLTSNK